MEELIFTKEEINRIHKSRSQKHLYVDLHGMNRNQAKRFLHNLIALHRESFQLSVIHGYNNGTVLKEMVNTETLSKRVRFRKCTEYNPGRTDLLIA